MPLSSTVFSEDERSESSEDLVFFYRKFIILNVYELLTYMDCPFTVVPTALGTAMDINLSNESLVFISVTFATMVSYFICYGRSMQLFRNLRVKQSETCLMIFPYFFICSANLQPRYFFYCLLLPSGALSITFLICLP